MIGVLLMVSGIFGVLIAIAVDISKIAKVVERYSESKDGESE